MKFIRILILASAAALTAGTCTAGSILFNLYSGAGNTQPASLSIDDQPVNSLYGAGTPLSQYVTLTDGWHKIAIDYNASFGTDYLNLMINYGWVMLPYLGSYDADGNKINGLTGDYYVDGTQQFTKYGEGPINHGSGGGAELYNGVAGLWAGTYTTSGRFEEKLSGYVFVDSTGKLTPVLNDIPDAPHTDPPPVLPSDPPPSDSSDVPEPAGWWLMAAGLPLVLISRLRLSPAKTRH